MLELHCHTTYSDGTLTPGQLVARAARAGVRALAITDHDTLAGWPEAIAAGAVWGVEIVPGVELSTELYGRSLHVLGFYPERDRLEPPLQERVAGRWRRAEAIAAKLAALGYPIALPEPRPGLAPTRPHLAQALVAAGHAAFREEAFDRWLHDGGPAYVPYEKFSAVEGIRLLRACGAVVVWAHPHLFRGGAVEAVLPELVAAGLQGVEVYHPCHRAAAIAQLEALSQEYGLLRTGGSDYHGPNARGVEETQLNQAQLPLELLAAVQAARDGYSPMIS